MTTPPTPRQLEFLASFTSVYTQMLGRPASEAKMQKFLKLTMCWTPIRTKMSRCGYLLRRRVAFPSKACPHRERNAMTKACSAAGSTDHEKVPCILRRGLGASKNSRAV